MVLNSLFSIFLAHFQRTTKARLPSFFGDFGKPKTNKFGRTQKLNHLQQSICPCNSYQNGTQFDRTATSTSKVFRQCNSNDTFIKAWTCSFQGIPHTSEAEVFALCQALQWISELQLHNIIFETDSKMISDNLVSTATSPNTYHTILSNCRQILSSITNSRASYVRRHANVVAHNLARASRFYASSHDFNYISSCIFSTIMNEMIYDLPLVKKKKKNASIINFN